MATYDPINTATQLATVYTQAAQQQLTNQTQAAQATTTGLTKLQSALRSFDTAIAGLSGKKSLQQNSATFNSTTFGTASATALAAPGSYSMFVEKVATAHQVMFSDLPAVPVPMTGKLSVAVSGASFDVDFSVADVDGNGSLSQSEIARAINQATDNQGKVSATIVTSGTSTQMILTAGETGAASQITLNTSALTGDAGNAAALGNLKTALGAGQTLVAPDDSIVWLGAQGTGVQLQQASNTVTAIEGVSMSFTKAMGPTDSPLTLTVASDSSGTAANVKAFIDAYNSLKSTLDDLTKNGDADAKVAAGAFASDSSVRSLRDRMSSMLRQEFNGQRLMDFGVSASREGVLSLDTAKLDKKIAASPDGLDQLFGKASLTDSKGLLGGLDKYLDTWLNSTSGQITRRQQTVQLMQKSLTQRQTRLDTQYDNAYTRYLNQFTQLANLEAQMSQTTSIFDNMPDAN